MKIPVHTRKCKIDFTIKQQKLLKFRQRLCDLTSRHKYLLFLVSKNVKRDQNSYEVEMRF